MAKLIVKLEDRELRRLRAAARARHINPAHLTKAELCHLLALQGNQKYPGRLAGGAVRALSLRGLGGVHQIVQAFATAAASKAPMDSQLQNGVFVGREARLRAGLKRAKHRGTGVEVPIPEDTVAANDAAAAQAERAKRLAAVMSMHGIWKDDPTKPQDGAEYQREVRAEWR